MHRGNEGEEGWGGEKGRGKVGELRRSNGFGGFGDEP